MKHIGWFRILVIGCYVPDQHDAFEAAMKKLASYSDSPLSRADRDKFAFGWLDSDKYVNYISKFFVYPEQVPTLFVWNRQDQVFYNYDGRADDVDAMAEFFINILTGKERAIAQGNYFLKIYRFMVRGYPWSLLWLFPMGFIAFFLIVGCAAVWTHDSAAEKRALTKSQEPAIRAAQPPIDAKKSE
ncbi:hypothetical protein DYB32_000080 [Aphanomyces invadans]|nr:hypothetical protein DYB32_000080 [Aphanomyces invadans]